MNEAQQMHFFGHAAAGGVRLAAGAEPQQAGMPDAEVLAPALVPRELHLLDAVDRRSRAVLLRDRGKERPDLLPLLLVEVMDVHLVERADRLRVIGGRDALTGFPKKSPVEHTRTPRPNISQIIAFFYREEKK